MDKNDDRSRTNCSSLPTAVHSNRPRCLADGVIPWMAGHIEWIAIERIKVPVGAVRRHPKRQIHLLTKALREYGFTTPLLADHDFTLILGDGRLQAAKAVGMDVVPVVRVAHLTDRQITALKLADNRIAEQAEWNWETVAGVLEKLAVDCDIELTGFSVAGADLVIAHHLPKPHDAALDTSPKVDLGPPVAQIGDVFLLGGHRVACCDCRDQSCVARLMNGSEAAASFCDAPVGFVPTSNVSECCPIKRGEFERSDREYFDALVAYLTDLRAISAASAVHYSCIDWRSIDMLIGAIRCVGGTLLDICTWAKSQAGTGALYRSQTEFIAVFQFGDAKKGNSINLKIGGRNRSNLWPYAEVKLPNRPRSKEPAPGSKPVRLIADAILDSTRRGDIIFDAFLTFGSTLIAAEETGRVCHGVEIRPTHLDVVIRRWQAFTGRQAQHVCTGLTFDELSTLRPSVKLLPLRGKTEA